MRIVQMAGQDSARASHFNRVHFQLFELFVSLAFIYLSIHLSFYYPFLGIQYSLFLFIFSVLIVY